MADESEQALIERADKLMQQHDEIVMELAMMATRGQEVGRHIFPRLLDATHRQMVAILKSKRGPFSDAQKAWLLEHAMEVLSLAGIRTNVLVDDDENKQEPN